MTFNIAIILYLVDKLRSQHNTHGKTLQGAYSLQFAALPLQF